jgi:hypothetical protein
MGSRKELGEIQCCQKIPFAPLDSSTQPAIVKSRDKLLHLHTAAKYVLLLVFLGGYLQTGIYNAECTSRSGSIYTMPTRSMTLETETMAPDARKKGLGSLPLP